MVAQPAAIVMIAPGGRPSAVPPRSYTVATDALIVVLMSALLLPRLDRFGGLPQTWETSVLWFWKALYEHESLARFFREYMACLGPGAFSEGHTALLYGLPALASMQAFGLSWWTLRLPAVVAVVVAAILIRRTGARLYGPLAGIAAGLAFACNAAVLFYGRYASSVAATMLGCALALWACGRFLTARGWRALPWGVGTAVAVAIATLEYAPGRLVALALLGVLPIGVLQRRNLSRLAGMALLALLLFVGWTWERPWMPSFLSARGESILSCLQTPTCMRRELGHELNGGWQEALALGFVWAARNGPDYTWFVWPWYHAREATLYDGGASLPRLAWQPWVALALLGAVCSLRHVLRWEHCLLFAWWVVISIPGALLTTHADSHRLSLLTIPCALWCGIAVETVVAMVPIRRRMRALSVALASLAVLMAFTVAYDLRVLPYQKAASAPPLARELAAQMRTARAVDVPGGMDVRELTWVVVEAARGRADEVEPPRLLDGETRRHVAAGDPSAIARTVGAGRVLLLYPATDFQAAAPALSAAGDVSVRNDVMVVRPPGV